MAKLPTREQYIKRAKLIRGLMRVVLKLAKIGPKNKSKRTEIYIDTEFGKVRTLWYGFQNKETAPIYFDLHGGGFILGSADMDEEMNLELTKQVGCKIISIDYAKAPEFPYPAAVNQVYAVVKHVFENAEKYAIDSRKMAIGGHSAGGNLGTVTCMKAKVEGDFQFACQILDYPPLDLATSALDKPRPKGAISPKMALMFDACYVDPSQAKDPYVSPVYTSQEELENMPPALFILAGRDSLHDEGVKYCRMLKTAGVPTDYYDYANARHGFTYKPSPDAIDAWAKMAVFLRKYLY
ncbi:alpha/beta hydrolase [Cohnella suwonensis]|uniref:Alpha/beta hydrolase n=1 Tax=Cohnella suwonensis TaxID=696072 RepID=A0ABW0LYP8_9BACL